MPQITITLDKEQAKDIVRVLDSQLTALVFAISLGHVTEADTDFRAKLSLRQDFLTASKMRRDLPEPVQEFLASGPLEVQIDPFPADQEFVLPRKKGTIH